MSNIRVSKVILLLLSLSISTQANFFPPPFFGHSPEELFSFPSLLGQLEKSGLMGTGRHYPIFRNIPDFQPLSIKKSQIPAGNPEENEIVKPTPTAKTLVSQEISDPTKTSSLPLSSKAPIEHADWDNFPESIFAPTNNPFMITFKVGHDGSTIFDTPRSSGTFVFPGSGLTNAVKTLTIRFPENSQEHQPQRHHSLFDILGPQLPTNRLGQSVISISKDLIRPKSSNDNNDCEGVTCAKPDFSVDCQIEELKVNSRPSSLFFGSPKRQLNCCPIHICTLPDGSIKTHYGLVYSMGEKPTITEQLTTTTEHPPRTSVPHIVTKTHSENNNIRRRHFPSISDLLTLINIDSSSPSQLKEMLDTAIGRARNGMEGSLKTVESNVDRHIVRPASSIFSTLKHEIPGEIRDALKNVGSASVKLDGPNLIAKYGNSHAEVDLKKLFQ